MMEVYFISDCMCLPDRQNSSGIRDRDFIVLSRLSGYTLGTADSERVEFDEKRIKWYVSKERKE